MCLFKWPSEVLTFAGLFDEESGQSAENECLDAAAACEAVGRQPECKGDVTSTMILGIALSETTGIYGFVTGLLLIFAAPGMFMNYLG